MVHSVSSFTTDNCRAAMLLLFTGILTGGLVGLTEVYVTSGNPPQTKAISIAKTKSANVTVYNTEQLSANKIRVGIEAMNSLSQRLTTTITELY